MPGSQQTRRLSLQAVNVSAQRRFLHLSLTHFLNMAIVGGQYRRAAPPPSLLAHAFPEKIAVGPRLAEA
jgi:hypothetical protein